MTVHRSSNPSIFGILEKDHKVTYLKLNQMDEALKKLRYEGKLNRGRNLSEIGELTDYFSQELNGHMREEEKVLFPFLRTHIPRLEPMVHLLSCEHDDFKESLGKIKKTLNRCKKQSTASSLAIEQICQNGTYLVCLLRSHMWVESRSLYKAADKELRADEKKKLIARLGE